MNEAKEDRPPSFGMCGRCYEDGVHLFQANCSEKPEALAGAPLGQYHCPDCGTMVVAGVPHPPMCRVCIERKNPGFDIPNRRTNEQEREVAE